MASAPQSTTLRPRIVDLVGRAAVVCIEAPGGWGKSTLAEQLAAAWEQVTVRARCQPDDAVDAFVTNLARSTRRAGLGDVTAVGPGNPSPDVLDALVRTLGAAGATIVVDDAHHLAVDDAATVADALRDLTATCRIIVAGRLVTGFDSLRAAAPSLVDLDADDLRLTREEAATIIGADARSVIVEEVMGATDGWCAAVALAAARLRRDPSWSPSQGGNARALVVDLLAEVTDASPAWADLAGLPLLDADAVAIVAGPGQWDALMRSGIVRRTEGRWYRIPDPFAEVLAERGTLTREAAARLADHYRRHGEPVAAVAVLAAADGAALAAFLAGVHWSELIAVGPAALAAALDRAGEASFAEQSRGLLNIACAVERADPRLRTRCLDAADRLERGHRDPTDRQMIDAERTRDLLAAGELDTARVLAEQVLAREPAVPVARARAMTTLGQLEVFASTPASLVAGAAHYAEAARLLEDLGEAAWLADVLGRRGYTALHLAGASLAGAEEVHRAIGLLPTGDPTRAWWLTCYADILLYLGRTAEAEAAVAEAIEIGDRRRDAFISMAAWWSRSWIAARTGDTRGFGAAIDQCDRLLGPQVRAGQVVEYHGSTAELAAMLGDHDRYQHHIEAGRVAAEQLGYHSPTTIAEAKYAAMHGDPAIALAALDALENLEGSVPLTRPGRVLLRALALARLGDVDAAAAAASEAQAEAERFGVPDLLPRYERPLLSAYEEIAEPPPGAARFQPIPTIRVLGTFAVEVAGEDCSPRTGNPSTLVKLLALNGTLTIDAAVDVLWPDADLTTGRARLRNVISRVRERAGDLVVRDDDRLRLAAVVKTDLGVFEDAAADALAATADERVGRARHAIALYGGELLPGNLYDDWSAMPRERAKRRYLALVDLVADDCVNRGELDEAVRLLDLGIDAEPLDSRRYSRMAGVLVLQGRRRAAREVAERALALFGDLGEAVDPELSALVAI